MQNINFELELVDFGHTCQNIFIFSKREYIIHKNTRIRLYNNVN